MEKIELSDHVLEPALDSQYDSPGQNFTCNTVSVIDDATKKLINISVIYTNVWHCLNRTIHCIRFSASCTLPANCQYHNITGRES